MTRIAYLVTSAREMTLADGTAHPTGYFAEEALKPYERFVAAGFDVTVMTPDGNPPHADPYGLSWFFHYPDDDKDYLASVVRTFAHDVDDIRLTLHQNTELGLAAARRVVLLLQQQGRSPAEARQVVCAAVKTAWQQDRQFADVLSEDGSLGLTTEQIQAEVDAQRADSERLAAERHCPGCAAPVTCRPATPPSPGAAPGGSVTSSSATTAGSTTSAPTRAGRSSGRTGTTSTTRR
jgi:putative intracellular protease/amidase